MPWSAEDIPDLTGRVAVVTGANGGLGRETARELARKGAHVVMAARDQEKAARAEAEIRADVDGPSLELVALDLGSLDSVREAARRMVGAHERIDILVNNAGVMGIPERRTADGFEMQLGVNHLGHWVLTARLLPALQRASAARIVSVTSTAHHLGRALDPDNPHLEGHYDPWRAYFNSKLANFHFGIGLERRLRQAGAPAASLLAHPGLTNSDLQTHAAAENPDDRWARFWDRASSTTGMSEPRGALSQLRAATDPDAKGGELYGPLWMNSGPPIRKPILRRIGVDRAIDTLWQVSERETGERLEL